MKVFPHARGRPRGLPVGLVMGRFLFPVRHAEGEGYILPQAILPWKVFPLHAGVIFTGRSPRRGTGKALAI